MPAPFCQKSQILHASLAFYCGTFQQNFTMCFTSEKIRTMGPLVGEKMSTIQYCSVTDRQTDRYLLTTQSC